MNNKIMEHIKLWGLPIIIGFLLIILFKPFVSFIPRWFTNIYSNTFSTTEINKNISKIDTLTTTITSTNSPNVTGPIGDTFGGTLGPVIALLAAFLTFLAFWIQYRANRLQEKYIMQQRFEDTFFRLLDHHKKILDSMDIRDANNPSLIKATGYECFRSMYIDLKKVIADNKTVEYINKSYDFFQNHYKHDLHHYFRFLYHVLKFIKNSEISETQKFKYSSILRASLSAYELVFIFYNCLHENGVSHFKPLLEEFSFLKNMDESLLIIPNQKNEYHPLAFSSSKERPKLLKDWYKCKRDKS